MLLSSKAQSYKSAALEGIHVFKEVTGVMSWKARKVLGILPPCYPTPLPAAPAAVNSKKPTNSENQCSYPTATTITHRPVDYCLPTVFDRQIRVMQGEEFHIAITDTAK